MYTDTIYANTSGSNYSTIVVDDSGNLREAAFNGEAKYICAHPLISLVEGASGLGAVD